MWLSTVILLKKIKNQLYYYVFSKYLGFYKDSFTKAIMKTHYNLYIPYYYKSVGIKMEWSDTKIDK